MKHRSLSNVIWLAVAFSVIFIGIIPAARHESNDLFFVTLPYWTGYILGICGIFNFARDWAQGERVRVNVTQNISPPASADKKEDRRAY